MQDDGIDPVLPPCSVPRIVDTLFEIGPTVSAGMGAGPISHSEIESYQRNTGAELGAWDCLVLRRLSRDYAVEGSQAVKRDRPAPYSELDQIVSNRDAVASKVKAFIGSSHVSRGNKA